MHREKEGEKGRGVHLCNEGDCTDKLSMNRRGLCQVRIAC